MSQPGQTSAQAYLNDPRNEQVLVCVNGEFVPREQARVSVFDSGFTLGDGVWEGLRLVQGRILSLQAHLDRLYEGACSIAIDIGLTREQLTLIQAINAGADEALMLDPRGFVGSCNSTNFFIVRGGELWTSTGACSFKGITQASVAAAWHAAGGTVRECDFTLAQVYNADEAFVTGTLGGVTPVVRVDGRLIGNGAPGPQTALAGQRYLQRVLANG